MGCAARQDTRPAPPALPVLRPERPSPHFANSCNSPQKQSDAPPQDGHATSQAVPLRPGAHEARVWLGGGRFAGCTRGVTSPQGGANPQPEPAAKSADGLARSRQPSGFGDGQATVNGRGLPCSMFCAVPSAAVSVHVITRSSTAPGWPAPFRLGVRHASRPWAAQRRAFCANAGRRGPHPEGVYWRCLSFDAPAWQDADAARAC